MTTEVVTLAVLMVGGAVSVGWVWASIILAVLLAVVAVGGLFYWNVWEDNYLRQIKDKTLLVGQLQDSQFNKWRENAVLKTDNAALKKENGELKMQVAAYETAKLAGEENVMSRGKLTPGRALAQQRAHQIRKIKRVLKCEIAPEVRKVLLELVEWLQGGAKRYNKRKGGLGK